MNKNIRKQKPSSFFYDNQYLHFQKNELNIHNPHIGFIILRHVNSDLTNTYWIKCYDCIRKYYPENSILIIDDDSNKEYLTVDKKLYKTDIVNSEYPKRGELLPYYYFLKLKPFNKAVILHDSVFINRYINFDVEDYKLLWHFDHIHNNPEVEKQILRNFNNKPLLNFYNNKNLWRGCFGGMSVVTYNYLSEINKKYDLNKLLNLITNRKTRMAFERIIACLLQINKPNPARPFNSDKSLLNLIHHYCPWGLTMNGINNEKIQKLPLIKIWSGR